MECWICCMLILSLAPNLHSQNVHFAIHLSLFFVVSLYNVLSPFGFYICLYACQLTFPIRIVLWLAMVSYLLHFVPGIHLFCFYLWDMTSKRMNIRPAQNILDMFHLIWCHSSTILIFSAQGILQEAMWWQLFFILT